MFHTNKFIVSINWNYWSHLVEMNLDCQKRLRNAVWLQGQMLKDYVQLFYQVHLTPSNKQPNTLLTPQMILKVLLSITNALEKLVHFDFVLYKVFYYSWIFQVFIYNHVVLYRLTLMIPIGSRYILAFPLPFSGRPLHLLSEMWNQLLSRPICSPFPSSWRYMLRMPLGFWFFNVASLSLTSQTSGLFLLL